jgi:hypothetical protein
MRAERLAFTPPAALPATPPAMPSLRDIWLDPDNWRVSSKGNRFVRIDGAMKSYCVTIFPRRGAWAWCIGGEFYEPIWSPVGYDAEAEAREAAWKALEELER